MWILIAAIIGFALGSVSVFFLLDGRRRAIAAQQAEATLLSSEAKAERAAAEEAYRNNRKILADINVLNQRAIDLKHVESENTRLKRGLASANISAKHHKVENEVLRAKQAEVASKAQAICKAYLEEVEKGVAARGSIARLAVCESRVKRAIEWCRDTGFAISPEEEAALLGQLKADLGASQEQADTVEFSTDAIHELSRRYAGSVGRCSLFLAGDDAHSAGRKKLQEALDWCKEIGIDFSREERNRLLDAFRTDADAYEASRSQLSRLEKKSNSLAARYLSDVEKSVAAAVTANNYASCKARLTRAIEWCREIGFDVPLDEENRLLEQLKADFEAEVRKQVQREEQARIKAQIREEEKRNRELEREMETIRREREILEKALEKARQETASEQGAEIERLKQRLAEAEERQRTISQAQLTKAGHIYVISNIGSFGDGVYKIGMTRRLDPSDRVDELGDASVPFSFDVHMMISCSDAPALEYALHKKFHTRRVNKVNPRKEYFRVDLEAIRSTVEELHGKVDYVAEPDALEFRQSATMSDEDLEIIENAFEKAEQSVGLPSVED